MRTAPTNLTVLTLVLVALVACSESATNPASDSATSQAPTPAQSRPVALDPVSSPIALQGEVIETMDSGRYTYVRLQTGDQAIWVAGPTAAVEVGDNIKVVRAMEMKDFHSRTLERTFESIWFADGLAKEGELAGLPHGSAPKGAATMSRPVEGTESTPKAEGGYTVAELFTKRNDLSEKPVAVRGKVVKYSAQILGKNWLHLQDGTGVAGTNDLTVTSTSTAKIGDTVLIQGTLVLGKDFGAGYKYDVMIENAQITVED